MLVLYGIERLLYRLSVSPVGDRFILKGASLFSLWIEEPHRRTRDIDLLAKVKLALESVTGFFQDLCRMQVGDDGLRFPAEMVKAKLIRQGDGPGGIRVTLIAFLDKATIALQVDIGFGDEVSPEPDVADFPTLLPDFPAPRLSVYQKETTIAEKLHAIVTLDRTNTRMKDFFDLYVLSCEFEFTNDRLTAAVQATFGRRGTAIPIRIPDGLTQDFASDAAKLGQWKAFLRQNVSAPRDTLTLSEVITRIAAFLLPILEASHAGATGESVVRAWDRDGRWRQGPI